MLSSGPANTGPSVASRNKNQLFPDSQEQLLSKSSLSSGFDQIDEDLQPNPFCQDDENEAFGTVTKIKNSVKNSNSMLKNPQIRAQVTDLSISTWKRVNQWELGSSRLKTIVNGPIYTSKTKPYFFDSSKPSDFDSRIFLTDEQKVQQFSRVLIEHDLEPNSDDQGDLIVGQVPAPNRLIQTKIIQDSVKPSYSKDFLGKPNSITRSLVLKSSLSKAEYRSQISQIHSYTSASRMAINTHKECLDTNPEANWTTQVGSEAKQVAGGVIPVSPTSRESQPTADASKVYSHPDRFRLSKRPSRKALLGMTARQPADQEPSPSGLSIIPLIVLAKPVLEEKRLSEEQVQPEASRLFEKKKSNRIGLQIAGKGIQGFNETFKETAKVDENLVKPERKQSYSSSRSPRCNTLPSEPILGRRNWIDMSQAPRIPERGKRLSVVRSDQKQSTSTSKAEAAENSNAQNQLSSFYVYGNKTETKQFVKGQVTTSCDVLPTKPVDINSRISLKANSYYQPLATELPMVQTNQNAKKSWISEGPEKSHVQIPEVSSHLAMNSLDTLMNKRKLTSPRKPYNEARNTNNLPEDRSPLDSKPFLQIRSPILRAEAKKIEKTSSKTSQQFLEPTISPRQAKKSKEIVRLFRKISEFNKTETTAGAKQSLPKHPSERKSSTHQAKISHAQAIAIAVPTLTKLPRPFRVLTEYRGETVALSKTDTTRILRMLQ
jgi:hypothetical protein